MEMKFLLFLLIFLINVVFMSEDYYNILGVKRDATKEQIRKAFKKKAMQYHPDKNKANPEKAKEMFQKVSNAYDVLYNDEKRRIYDLRGEEGIRQSEQDKSAGYQGFNRGNDGDFFNNFHQFFSSQDRNRGGQKNWREFRFFHNNFENGGNFNKFFNEQEEEDRAYEDVSKLLKESNFEILDLSSMSKFYQRTKIWVILFFKNEKVHGLDKILVELQKFAKDTLGMFVVGVADCSKEEEICDELSTKEPLNLILYPEENNTISYKIPLNYKAEDIKNKAVKIMKNYVINVKESSYDEFMKKDPNKIHIILFSDKQWPTPMYKYFSSKYQNYFVFGFVNVSQGALFRKHSILRTPSIIAINDLNFNNPKGIKYEGEIKIGPIDRFLKSFTNKRVIDKNKNTNNNTNENENPIRFTKNLLSQGKCKQNDINWCYLVLLSKESADQLLKIKSLMKSYSSDNIDFYYYILDNNIQTINFLNFINSFQPLLDEKTKMSKNCIIAIHSSKRKFTIIEDFDTKNLNELKLNIDNILSGSGQFQKFQKIKEEHFNL